PRNTIILSEGDETDSLYIIVSGRVKVFLSDDAGKEVVLGTQGPGDYFGEMAIDGRPRSASVMTLEPSQFAVIPKAKFREFVRSHPDFAVHVIEKLAGRIRTLTENFKSLALLDVYGRVARLLLDLARDQDGKLVVGERLTHQEIASRVGASREMISKIFKGLSQGGYISVDRRRIIINKTPPRHW
ncbi:MAG: Crp/Fnr family transcriptional regulator, partial [Betaproteobacteria bacterium]